jgi:hypothetical protein
VFVKWLIGVLAAALAVVAVLATVTVAIAIIVGSLVYDAYSRWRSSYERVRR